MVTRMAFVTHFKCFNCGSEFQPAEVGQLPVSRCRRCGSALDVEYDISSIRRVILRDSFLREEPSHWKYWAFLPVSDLSHAVTMGEGGTPLLENPRLTSISGVQRLLFKYEASNPTGSFKDRGTSVEITKALEFGRKRVVVASTGNMGASIAAYAAYSGLECIVYVPGIISSSKLRQIKAHGAEIRAIKGDYADAMMAAENYAREDPESFLTGDYPWRSEGTKTVGFEIVDQLYWRNPDAIFVPIGNGTLIWSIYEAIEDLNRVGILNGYPRLIGVQVEACSPVIDALWAGRGEIMPVENPQTVASAIAVGDPIDGMAALRAIRETGGDGAIVSDEEVLRARNEMAKAGILVEPSGAVAYAGAKMHDLVGTVVCIATGHGLKDLTGI